MAKRSKDGIHEIAHLFPYTTDEEFQSIKASIKKMGVRMPVWLWHDPDTDEDVLIDGKNRRKAYEELVAEGVTHTDNGELLELPTWQWNGTLEEALDATEQLNMSRRQLSKSQRAAIAVKSGAMRRRIQAKLLGKKPSELPPEVEGDAAEAAALKAGVNRTYIFDCMKIMEEGNDKHGNSFIDKVISGEKNINEVKAAIARQHAGLDPWDRSLDPDENDPNAKKDNGPPEAAEVPAVLDGFGNEVPERVEDAFKERVRVKRLIGQLKKLREEMGELFEGPGGAMYEGTALLKDVSNIQTALNMGQPHCVCPFCNGHKKRGGKPCKECHGGGALDKIRFKTLSDEEKAIASGKSKEELALAD